MSLITILGPTASGKTSFATHLAYQLHGEIISADSRQIYRQMDIGTGKDLSDYVVHDTAIPYHLIDIREAGEKYTLFNYQHDFHKAYHDIITRQKLPILCGGTGLYIESVLKGYNLPHVSPNPSLRKALENKTLTELAAILSQYKTLHNTTDIDTRRRAIRAIEIAEFQSKNPNSRPKYPAIESIVLGIKIDRETRRKNISHRLRKRLDEGLVQEVEQLLNQGITAEQLIYYGLEYKFVTLYLQKKITYKQMFSELEIAIHQFAKRQMTWFRGMERRGFTIHWIDYTLSMDDKISCAVDIIEKEKRKKLF